MEREIAKVNEIKKTNKVDKSNFLARVSYRLKTNEQKLVLMVISKINRYDKDFKTYEIPVKAIAGILGVGADSKFYRQVKDMTFSILKKPFKYFNEKGEEVQQNWFSVCKYGNGIAKFRFDKELKPYLLDLKKNFTSYQLGYAVKLNSFFSIKLYQLLKSYDDVGRYEATIDELKWGLGINIDEYYRYNDFKKRILLPAQKELKEKTDISFTFKETKRVRKINTIKFIIKYNLQKAKEIKEGEKNLFEYNDLHWELLKHGLSEGQAMKICKEQTEEYIKERIEWIAFMQKTNPREIEKYNSKGKLLFIALNDKTWDLGSAWKKKKQEIIRAKIFKEKAFKEKQKKEYKEYCISLCKKFDDINDEQLKKKIDRQAKKEIEPFKDKFKIETIEQLLNDTRQRLIFEMMEKVGEFPSFEKWIEDNQELTDFSNYSIDDIDYDESNMSEEDLEYAYQKYVEDEKELDERMKKKGE